MACGVTSLIASRTIRLDERRSDARACSSTAGAGRSRRRGATAGSPSCSPTPAATVIGVDLLGHGEAPKPHDPAAYADLTTRIVDVLPDEPVDAVGFSLGAITLLRLAARRPERFRRIVAAGHRAQRVRARPRAARPRILAGVEGTADPTTTTRPACSASTPPSPATTAVALAAVMRRPDEGPFTPRSWRSSSARCSS